MKLILYYIYHMISINSNRKYNKKINNVSFFIRKKSKIKNNICQKDFKHFFSL